MSSKAIERISMPSSEVFYREYVLPQKPVIITNLFQDQPIESISSLEQARTVFSEIDLQVTSEYSRASTNVTPITPGVMKFGDYLDFAKANPSTPLMCTEYGTPARVSAQYRLPDLCKADHQDLHMPELIAIPRRWGDHDLMSNMFLGNRGNYAHLHYDGDHRQVLLYQVFGRKRVILFQPSNGTKLDVLNAYRPGSSNIYLEKKTEEEKSAFVEEANGCDGIIGPGEAIYMPMLFWHYLEYIDIGMSVNFRFRRNRYGRFLSVDNFHRDYYKQNFSTKMVDPNLVQSKYFGAIELIKARLLKPSSSRRDKIREMRAIFKTLCCEISPEADPEWHCPPELEERELSRIEADLSGTQIYLNNVTSSPLTEGPISSSQHLALHNRLKQMNYPSGVIETIIYNRFAKSGIDELTRTEAALLLRTFTSPGAAWG